jgi:hypothetical protein
MSGDIMILAKDVDYSRMVGKVCYLSEKVDGIPGIFTKDQAPLSRQGNPILSVPHINDIVQWYLKTDLTPVIVGELYVPGQPFKVSGGIIRRQEPQVDQGIKLRIWDAYFPEEMDLTYQQRMVKANPWLQSLLRDQSGLFEMNAPYRLLPMTAEEAKEEVLNFSDLLVQKAKELGYPRPEGVIIRTHDEPYKLGRSWGLMRYVEKPTIDLKVVGFNEAKANKTMSFLGDNFFKGEGLRAIGKIFVQYGDEVIGVGPGCMTHTERRDYFLNPRKLVGQIIKIQYKHDESYKALRQPTFVCIHPDKTTPDA